ncbi:type II toxin-antitoxin system RelE/ParE family toxin [Cardiobacterium sp. AH-315-I02]|nr:type II toxin-antitoxin system RelE/ParE family toxin [Cardiobacterium sp. AH-315-I02]
MLTVLIRPLARNDIKKIWRYTYNNWGEKQADFYANALGQAIEEMIENPEIGNSIEHIRKGYRLYHFKHHFVIYRLSLTVIDVVRVLGENMDIKRHL